MCYDGFWWKFNSWKLRNQNYRSTKYDTKLQLFFLNFFVWIKLRNRVVTGAENKIYNKKFKLHNMLCTTKTAMKILCTYTMSRARMRLFIKYCSKLGNYNNARQLAEYHNQYFCKVQQWKIIWRIVYNINGRN